MVNNGIILTRLADYDDYSQPPPFGGGSKGSYGGGELTEFKTSYGTVFHSPLNSFNFRISDEPEDRDEYSSGGGGGGGYSRGGGDRGYGGRPQGGGYGG